MPLTIGYNKSSLQAQRALERNSAQISNLFERLSSGQRIQRAADDAAGLAIAEALNVDSRVFNQAVRNVNDGISVLTIADAAVTSLIDIVIRLQELSAQSANGTLAYGQRVSLNEEAQELSREYLRIVESAEFNGQALLHGDLDELRIQAGYGVDGGIASKLVDTRIGEGTFGSPKSYVGITAVTYDLTLEDLNGDDILDLIYCGRSDDRGLAVRLGIGDGTFSSEVSYSTEGKVSEALAVIDLNGDGWLDAVTAGRSASDDGYATVRLGNGDGTFQSSSVSYATESYASHDLKVVDINNDGKLDLLTTGDTDSSSDRTTIRLGNGDGTFQSSSVSYTANQETSLGLETADLNNDGKLDLITCGSADVPVDTGLATIRFGNGDGTFSAESTTYAAESITAYDVQLVDLNNDSILDLITGGNTGEGGITIRLGTGGGRFSDTALSYASGDTGTVYRVALEDVNGDGWRDAVTVGADDGNTAGTATIRLGNGDGTFSSEFLTYACEPTTSRALAAVDINNDFAPDLVTGGSGSGVPSYLTVRLANTKVGIPALQPFYLASREDSLQAVEQFEIVRQRLAAQRGAIGAFQSRLSVAARVLDVSRENFKTAESRIRDADIAEDSAALVRCRLLQQASAAILAQANQQPAVAFRLLG